MPLPHPHGQVVRSAQRAPPITVTRITPKDGHQPPRHVTGVTSRAENRVTGEADLTAPAAATAAAWGTVKAGGAPCGRGRGPARTGIDSPGAASAWVRPDNERQVGAINEAPGDGDRLDRSDRGLLLLAAA